MKKKIQSSNNITQKNLIIIIYLIIYCVIHLPYILYYLFCINKELFKLVVDNNYNI